MKVEFHISWQFTDCYKNIKNGTRNKGSKLISTEVLRENQSPYNLYNIICTQLALLLIIKSKTVQLSKEQRPISILLSHLSFDLPNSHFHTHLPYNIMCHAVAYPRLLRAGTKHINQCSLPVNILSIASETDVPIASRCFALVLSTE
jgi:hypothetical protein